MRKPRTVITAAIMGALLGAVAACGPTLSGKSTTAAGGAEPPVANSVSSAAKGTLAWAIQGPWRVQPERDVYRHPLETLTFFGIEPYFTVVEVAPGQGWYTSILGPYLNKGGGRLYAAHFDPNSPNEFRRKAVAGYKATFVDHPDVFGTMILTTLDANGPGIAPDGAADMVLTFRNVHNWMADGTAEAVFASFYRALKPGGVLGVEEHRLAEGKEQDPRAGTGYVSEDYVKQLAKEAGFEFVASSEINANPKDDTDHPFGVWTLPPVLRTSAFGAPPNPSFDRSPYIAIGESDRMTLKFVKPLTP